MTIGKAITKRTKKEEVREVQIENFSGTKMEQLHQLYDKWFGCQKCTLGQLASCRPEHEIVFGEGNPDAHVLIVGEAPGAEEEVARVPFVGPSGLLLNQLIAGSSADPDVRDAFKQYGSMSHGVRNKASIDEFHDFMFEKRHAEFFITNAVSCRPPDNRQPTQEELKTCWERLWNIIYIVDPWVIIACGNSALSAVMRKVSVKITAMRGSVYDVEYPGRVGPITYSVFPTFHPSYLLRKADWRVKDGDWGKTKKDFMKAMQVLDFLRERYMGTPIPKR